MVSSEGGQVGAGTIYREATAADPTWIDRARDREQVEHARTVQRLVEHSAALRDGVETIDTEAQDLDAGQTESVAPLDTFSAAEFAGKPVPQRGAIVPGLISDRNVTDFSAPGGTGKSQLALQLGIAMATHSEWLGLQPVGGVVLYVSAEDERDEIHRRMVAIVEHRDVGLPALEDLHFIDLTGAAHTELSEPDPENRYSLRMTPLFARLEAKIVELRPKLVILDTRADMFGGNEIDRAQVRTFVRNLQIVCRSYDLAILLISHPSRTGMAAGDGQSGSTGWLNSARGGLYLTRDPDDPDLRILQVTKANYGPAAAEIRLRWENGVFRRIDTLIDGKLPDREAIERLVDKRFLQHLADAELRTEYVNGNKTGSRYAPRCFARLDASAPDRIGEKQYEASMWRLKAAGRLATVKSDGPPAKQYDRFIVVDPGARLNSLAERQGPTS